MNKKIAIDYLDADQDPVPYYNQHAPRRQYFYISVCETTDHIVIYPTEHFTDQVLLTVSTRLPAWEINNLMGMIRDRILKNPDVSIDVINFIDIENEAESLEAVPIEHISEWWTANTHALDVSDEEIIEDVKKGYLHADDCIIFFPYHVDRYLQQLHDAQDWEKENYI